MSTNLDTQAALTPLAAAVDAADDPLTKLRLLAALSARATAATEELVGRARLDGHTWRELGESLGVTRQAACQRFSPGPDTKPKPARARQSQTEEPAAEFVVRTLWPGNGLAVAKVVRRPPPGDGQLAARLAWKPRPANQRGAVGNR